MLLDKLWERFFPLEKGVAKDNRLNLIDLLHKFFATNPPFLQSLELTRSKTAYFDLQVVNRGLPFTDFEGALVSNPIEVATCFGLALSVVANERSPYREDPILINAAFYNLSKCIDFANVKADTVGHLVSVEGSVSRITPSQPLVLRGGFRCYKCNQMTYLHFEDGVYQVPSVCGTPRCDNRILEFDRNEVQLSEFQRLRLSETSADHGMMPKMLEIELRSDLVNEVGPGDVIRVTGIIKTVQLDLPRAQRWASRPAGGRGGAGGGGGGFRVESAVHELFLQATAVVCLQTARENPRKYRRISSSHTGSADIHAHGSSSGGSGSGGGGSGGAGEVLLGADAEEDRRQLHNNNSDDNDHVDGFTSQELAYIRKTALSQTALYQFCAQLAPYIYGHEVVKMGLVLALFGGSSPPAHHVYTNSNNNSNNSNNSNNNNENNNNDININSNSSSSGRQEGGFVRHNIHVLLVGDAGMGKSRLLRACANLVPRSVCVSAATASTAGLTAAVTRDTSSSSAASSSGIAGSSSSSSGSDVCIEAGALVLADSGLCCVDELDKATGCDPQALLEALEQQRVSLAKGGAVLTLPARTTVVAAANPHKGRYDMQKSLRENLGSSVLTSALLSRFDLVCVMVDVPDEARDRRVGEHITVHSRGGAGGGAMHAINSNNCNNNFGHFGHFDHDDGMYMKEEQEGEEDMTLAQLLRRHMRPFLHANSNMHGLNSNNSSNDVDVMHMMRTYITYARRYVHPRLSPQAAKILQRHYLHLRKNPGGTAASSSGLPVTLRQLESLIRLAQSRARVDLREEVTARDATEVVMLSTEVAETADLFLNNSGTSSGVGRGRSRGGIGSQSRMLYEGMLREVQVHKRQAVFTTREVEVMVQRLGLVRDASTLIEALRDEGCLLKKGPDLYGLVRA